METTEPQYLVAFSSSEILGLELGNGTVARWDGNSIYSASDSTSSHEFMYSSIPRGHTDEVNRGGSPLSTALEIVNSQPRATFNIAGWNWANTNSGNTEDGNIRNTPRQSTLSLHNLPFHLQGASSQLRPIPRSVPEHVPSLYQSNTSNDEEYESTDDNTEADSFWFQGPVEDYQVVSSPSIANTPGMNNGRTMFVVADELNDFHDLELIITALHNTREDVVTEVDWEDPI
jgi:hypothetical protein